MFWLRLVARTVLLAAASLMLWATLPAAWGWQPTTVMSDSMAPRVLRGDIVVSIPTTAAHVKTGKVVLVDDPDHPGHLRLHRLIEKMPNGELITKGDANAAADSTPILPAALHGVALLRVPLVGLPIVWLREGDTVQLTAFAAVLFSAMVLAWGGDHPGRGRGGDTQANRSSPNGKPYAGKHPEGHGAQHRDATDRFSATRRVRVRMLATAGLAASALGLVYPLVSANAPDAHAAFASTTAASNSSLTAASSFECLRHPILDNPLVFYRFNEASGNIAADSSGNGLDATLSGSVTHLPGSCADNSSPAIRFDGTSGLLTTPSLSVGATSTLELWFTTTSTRGGGLLGAATSSTAHARQLYLSSDGRLNYAIGGVTHPHMTSPSTYNDGAWHHIIVVQTILGAALYADGNLVGYDLLLVPNVLPVNGAWTSGWAALSGWPNEPASNYLAGTISDMAIYATAFTAAQVTAHTNAGR